MPKLSVVLALISSACITPSAFNEGAIVGQEATQERMRDCIDFCMAKHNHYCQSQLGIDLLEPCLQRCN